MPNSTSTGSPRSTPRSCTQEGERRTCTSARCCSSRARRRTSATTSTTSAAACTWSRATGRSWRRRRLRPGARCGSTTRASTSSSTSATRRCRRPAPRTAVPARRPDRLPAAGPRQAAVGELARRGARRGDRFALIFKTHHSLVDGVSASTWRRCCSTSSASRHRPATGLEPWQPQPEPTAADLVVAGVRGVVTTTAELVGRGRSPPRPGRPRSIEHAARRRRGHRRDRLGGAQPRAGDAAQRRDRPAPALRGRAPAAVGLQAGQGRVRWDGQRRRPDGRLRRARATGCARAGCAPRASRCARSCPSRSAPRTSATSSATG